MNIQSSGLHVLQTAAKAGRKLEELQQATQGFESIFIKGMLKAMHSTDSDKLFGKSAGSDMYQDMLDDSLANAAAKRSQFGVGKLLFDTASTRAINEALQAKSHDAKKIIDNKDTTNKS